MRVAGRNVDDTKFFAVHAILRTTAVEQRSKTNDGLPLDDEKLLDLRLVPMIAACHTWLGARHENLAGVSRLEHLGQAAARVGAREKVVCEIVVGEIRQI